MLERSDMFAVFAKGSRQAVPFGSYLSASLSAFLSALSAPIPLSKAELTHSLIMIGVAPPSGLLERRALRE
jgi:hypothetical protein